VAHLLDAVDVSRTHEAADACYTAQGTGYVWLRLGSGSGSGMGLQQGRVFGEESRSWVEARVGTRVGVRTGARAGLQRLLGLVVCCHARDRGNSPIEETLRVNEGMLHVELPRVLGRSTRTTAVKRVCRFYFPLIHIVFSEVLA
jgi:hypothetical protein